MSTSHRPLRILLADDQHLVRSGFSLVLSTEADMEVVGQAADGESALELLRWEPADVVLMDIQMPGMGGIAATERIVAEGLAAVIMLTTFDRHDYLFGALRAGASGFLLKTASAEELVSAIRAVAEGHALISPEVTLPLIRRAVRDEAGNRTEPVTGAQEPRLSAGDAAALETLSEREKDVLVLMAKGLSNTEICERLVLSAATVKTHVSHLFAKTASRDRVHAVMFAYRAGLVDPARVHPGED